MNGGPESDAVRRGEAEGASASATPRNVVVVDSRIDSRALFGGARQLTIEHGDDAYTLRLTAQNKLILTK